MTRKYSSEIKLEHACLLYHCLEDENRLSDAFLSAKEFGETRYYHLAKEKVLTLINRAKQHDLENLAIFKKSIAELREAYELDK